MISVTDLTNVQILYQKKFIECCRNEINNLASDALENGIKIAFTRGIVLADDLYSDPEERFFGDIDIYINTCDLLEFVKLAKKSGYTFDQIEGDTDEESLHRGLRSIQSWHMHHFPVLKKTVRAFFKFNILLEVHTQLFPKHFHQVKNDDLILMQTALENTISHLSPLYKSVYVLNPLDECLTLFVHSAKHFFYDIMTILSCNGEEHNCIDMRHIIDLDLHLKKYKHDLNILINEASKWGIVSECVFMLRMLMRYGLYEFSQENYYDVYLKHKRPIGFVDFSIGILLSDSKFDELVSLTNRELASHIIQHLNIDYPIFECSKSSVSGKISENSIFVIDENNENIFNKSGTHYKVNRFHDFATRWRCEGLITCDYLYLRFKFYVKTNNIYFKGTSPLKYGASDSIVLYFFVPNPAEGYPFMRKLNIALCMDKIEEGVTSQPYVVCNEYDYYKKCEVEVTTPNFICEFQAGDTQYELEIGLSWDFISSCIYDNKILFDINALSCDPSPALSILALASSMHYADVHDITSFACLKFV